MSDFMTYMLIRERLSCRTTRRLIQSQSRDEGDILEQLEVFFFKSDQRGRRCAGRCKVSLVFVGVSVEKTT